MRGPSVNTPCQAEVDHQSNGDKESNERERLKDNVHKMYE